jgi:hypothetical protein
MMVLPSSLVHSFFLVEREPCWSTCAHGGSTDLNLEILLFLHAHSVSTRPTGFLSQSFLQLSYLYPSLLVPPANPPQFPPKPP